MTGIPNFPGFDVDGEFVFQFETDDADAGVYGRAEGNITLPPEWEALGVILNGTAFFEFNTLSTAKTLSGRVIGASAFLMRIGTADAAEPVLALEVPVTRDRLFTLTGSG